MAAMVAILDFPRDNFSYFWLISHTNASYQVCSQLAFGLGVEAKNNFSYFWSTSHPDAS